MASIVGA
jgi:hypothetical protein